MNEQEEHIPKRASTFPLFSKYFRLQPLNVVEFSHGARKHFEDFIDAFKKRIQIEQTYAKSLEQVSKLMDKHIKPGTEKAISFVSSAFKVEHQQRSHQAKELAESLKTQIVEVCLEMNRNQSAVTKKMQKDLKKCYKQLASLEAAYGKALQNYQGINKDTEEMIITKNIMKYTTGIPQQKKIKLITKTMEGIKENKEYEKLYLQALNNYNQFSSVYNRQVQKQLDQAQNQIREQVQLEADCLRKLIVCEVSMFKNIQYDLINISKQMEALDTQRDVQIFVEETKNSTENCILPQIQEKEKETKEEANGLPTSAISDSAAGSNISVASSTSQDSSSNQIEAKKIIGKSMLSQTLLYVQEEYFSWMLSCKKSKKLRGIIQKIWVRRKADKIQNKSENDEKFEEEINQQISELIKLTKLMQNPNINSTEKSIPQPSTQEIINALFQITQLIADIWSSASMAIQKLNEMLATLTKYFSNHHYYRLLAYIFIEEYRIQQQVMIEGLDRARLCGKLLKILLDESLKRNDVFIIRGILGLLFTFYWVDDKAKRLLYQNIDVYQSDIWKKSDFWEAAIFETTYEQMAGFGVQKGENQAETMLRQRNLVFSQLASYCHYMIMLGITSKNVRLIVGRYCRLYEMSEEQNKDLSKMITNTNKQYKQMANTMAAKGEKFAQ